ncbi:MAG: DHH family phosphoesterase [Eubacteriales bacterium]
MPKNTKQKNDIRGVMQGIRKETAVIFVLTAFLCFILYIVLLSATEADKLYSGIFILVLYAVICSLVYFFLEKQKKIKSGSETLAPVMGRIMFDAVVKMNTPVFICDSSERIIWYNNATEELHSDKNKLYGELVSELFGVTLADIRSNRSEKGAKLSCEGRSFLVKYNHIKTDDNDFALIMTTETTELDALSAKMESEETVVCYIMIDNLAEMMQYDSEQYRPAAARIDEIIRDWADEYGGILKEYERDKYIFITVSRVLDELIAGRFDILDRVRAVKAGDTNLPLTISMGVSNITGSYKDREKAAHAALDMALQRGGDQAAVKGEGSIDFFGGVTKGVQKRTNVRSRVVSNELMSAAKNATNVIIMGHRNADFDAMGACVGLCRIVKYCGVRANIVINTADGGLIGCRKILEGDEDYPAAFVDSERALDLLETGTLVIVADVNNLENCEIPELAYRTEKLAVIDHHRKMSEFKNEPDVEYIEPSASSTCEIVAEMLEQVLPKDDLSPAEATVMLAGITLDTKQFTENVGTRTFSAAMYLRDRGASPSDVQELFRESFDDYMREAKFRRNVEIYRDTCAITIVDDLDIADRVIAAKAANNLLRVVGIEASFALVKLGNTIHISARSNGRLNVQLVLENMGGGGHFNSAGAQCLDRSVSEVVAELKSSIDKYM